MKIRAITNWPGLKPSQSTTSCTAIRSVAGNKKSTGYFYLEGASANKKIYPNYLFVK